MPFFGSANTANTANTGNAPIGNYLDLIPGMARGNLEPYVTRGNQASGDNEPENLFARILQEHSNAPQIYENMPNVWEGDYGQPERRQMARNPADFLDAIMRRYTPSEGYKYREKRALGAAGNAAAAGGVAGTLGDQETRANLVRELMSQDQGEFLRNILGIQDSGLGQLERESTQRLTGAENAQRERMGGRERSIDRALRGRTEATSDWARYLANRNEAREGRGFNASTDLTSILGTSYGNQASQAIMERRQQMQREADEQASRANRRRGLMGFLGQGVGAVAGGVMGGGPGAALGSRIGGSAGGMF